MKGIDHIGIAVEDLEKGIARFQHLGLILEKTERVESEEVNIAFFPVGEIRLELLEGLSSDSPVTRFVRQRGEGLHHLCFRVNHIEQTLDFLRQKGIQLIHKKPVCGSGGPKIAFLHPKSCGGLLIELQETNPAPP